jgi:hypothetical protein
MAVVIKALLGLGLVAIVLADVPGAGADHAGWTSRAVGASAVTPDPGAVEGSGPPGILIGPVGG